MLAGNRRGRAGALVATLTLVTVAVAAGGGLRPATAAPEAGAASACAAVTQSNDATGQWVSTMPQWPAGEPATNLAFDVARNDPDVIVVTNGHSVQRTTDGGCGWQTIWPTSSSPGDTSTRVAGVTVAPQAGVPHVHLRLADTGDATGPVAVVSSHDGGASWFVADAPIVGGVATLHVSTDAPMVLTAVTDDIVAPAELWRSGDGGRRWVVVNDTLREGNVTPNLRAAFVAGDSSAEEMVALFGCRRPYLSPDGGRTLHPIVLPEVDSPRFQEAVTARPGPGVPAVITISAMRSYCTGATMAYLYRSEDGGATWRVGTLGKVIDGPAFERDYIAMDLDGTAALTMVVVESGIAWLVDRLMDHEPVTTPSGEKVLDVVGLDDDRSFALLGETSVLRYTSARSLLAPGQTVEVDFGSGGSGGDELIENVCGTPNAPVRRQSGWTVADTPRFPEPPAARAPLMPRVTLQRMADVAVDRGKPGRMYATNGLAVLRTDDGGCSWRTVYELPVAGDAAAPSTSTTIIREIATPPTGPAGRVHLVVSDDSGFTEGRVTVITSDDAGGRWRAGQTFVTGANNQTRCAAASGCRLAIAPGRPDRLYLVLAAPVFTVGPDVLHVSDDGGRTWTQRSYPYDLVTGSSCCDHVNEVVVDPADPDRVWLTIEGEGLFRSDDGARTWAPVTQVELHRTNALALLDAARGPSGATRVITFDASSGDQNAIRSIDGGTTWTSDTARGLGSGLGSISTGRSGDTVVAADEGVYAYAAHLDLWVDVNVLGLAGLRDVEVDQGAESTFYLHADQTIAWFQPADLPTLTVPLRPEPDYSLPPLLPPDPASFEPGARRIELAPGQSVRLDYDLVLPATPTPLDVFFLLDASGSMGDDHRSLARQLESIVRDLANARIPLHVGLGTYRDLQERYRRLHDLAPPNGELVRKLYRLRAAGGTEPAYTALRQMATGSGIAFPGTGAPVPAGQGGSFRPDARRYVVHVTDEPLQPDIPHGDPATAILDLNAHAIGHIGLAAVPPPALGPEEAALLDPQLRALSLATGAVAPQGGVDCDGDGDRDLAPGDPLVCRIPRTDEGHPNLATPLVEILRSLHDQQAVSLAASDVELVPELTSPADLTAVNVAEDNRFPVQALVRCPPNRAGAEHPVVLAAGVRGELVAASRLTVACGFTAPVVPGFIESLPLPSPSGGAAGLAIAAPLLPPFLPVPAAGTAASTSPAASGSAAASSASSGAGAGQPGVGAAEDEEESTAPAVARAAGAAGLMAATAFAARPGRRPVLLRQRSERRRPSA